MINISNQAKITMGDMELAKRKKNKNHLFDSTDWLSFIKVFDPVLTVKALHTVCGQPLLAREHTVKAGEEGRKGEMGV